MSHAVFRFSLLKAKMNPKFRQNTHQSADILQKQHGKKKAKVRHSAVSAGPRNKSAGPKNTEMLTFGVGGGGGKCGGKRSKYKHSRTIEYHNILYCVFFQTIFWYHDKN